MTATPTVVTSIDTGSYPYGVTANPVTDMIYVANDGTGSLPSGIAVDSNTNEIFVANLGDNTFSVINGSSNRVISTKAGR